MNLYCFQDNTVTQVRIWGSSKAGFFSLKERSPILSILADPLFCMSLKLKINKYLIMSFLWLKSIKYLVYFFQIKFLKSP